MKTYLQFRIVAPALLLLALAAAPLAAADNDLIWVEGENPTRGQGYPHSWYSDQVQKGALSEGGWLSSFTDKADTEVAYDVQVPKDGDWSLWVRLNPVQSKASWKLGDGNWTAIDMSKATDNVNIANDGKPDLRFVAWVKLGKFPLKAGPTTLAFKLHSATSHHGGIDCFMLTTKPFMPSGKTKPGLAAKGGGAFDASAYLWVEGEDAVSSDLKPHNWYSDMVKKDQLSGNGWLSTFNGPAGAIADYSVEIPKDGEWTLWARANPIQAKVDYRIGSGEWQAIDCSKATDQVNIANDAKPDMRFVAWMKAGVLPLKAGKQSIAFRFDGAAGHHGALDCFVLASKPFTPNGKVKPGTTLGEADPGWFAFEPPTDEFAKDALLDLRGLNDRRAGEKGFIRSKGDDFADGAGNPIRFWAANAGPADDPDGADYLAARLSKNGVNLARIHGGWFDREGNDPKAINKERADKCFRQIQAFADQGVYTYLSIYFPLWMQLKASDGIAECAIGKNPMGLLLFEPTFQSHWKSWAKSVLTTKNPYTGKTLADDPALAFFEIQNEDSFFFWTFQPESFGPGPYRQLCQRFGAWAAKRHGSIDAAITAWKGERHKSDGEGRLGLYNAWDMTADGFRKSGPGKNARATDQIRFLAELQRQTYAELTAYLRKECGFKGVVTASNWTTADNRRLGAIERWTYTATDCIDRHGYFGGPSEGEGSGYMVRAGHTFTDIAAVLDPTTALTGHLQIAGKPHIQTEVMWNDPNRFIADGPLLLSSYAALQGTDGIFSFATHSGIWDTAGTSKWPMMRPGWLGQFPATALQYRRGDLKLGPTVLRQVVSVDDLFQFKGSGIVEGPNADFRLAEAPSAREAGREDAFDPYSYCVGRVERVIGSTGTPESLDLSKLIDRTRKVVISATGELRWDWGNGLVTVNSPKSQAITGFLSKAGSVKLNDVIITCQNDYGTIHVIALDGQPLASSRKILVQAFTEQKLFGWQTRNGRVIDVGRAPINIKEISATVAFANPIGLKAVVLDGNGLKRSDIPLSGGVLTLPKDALYTVLMR